MLDREILRSLCEDRQRGVGWGEEDDPRALSAQSLDQRPSLRLCRLVVHIISYLAMCRLGLQLHWIESSCALHVGAGEGVWGGERRTTCARTLGSQRPDRRPSLRLCRRVVHIISYLSMSCLGLQLCWIKRSCAFHMGDAGAHKPYTGDCVLNTLFQSYFYKFYFNGIIIICLTKGGCGFAEIVFLVKNEDAISKHDGKRPYMGLRAFGNVIPAEGDFCFL